MGDEPRDGAVLKTLASWLLDKVALLLDPDKREVVRGDLAETGESGFRAVIDILGLVVRRQAALWLDWRPWLTLLGIGAPLGMLLSLISRYWADGTSETIWHLSHHGSEYVRLDLFVVDYLALAGWGWTGGFAIGSLSRRSAWVNMLLFFAIVFGGTIGSSEIMRNDTRVFALFFYGQIMPAIVRVLFVVLPAIFGVRRAVDRRPLRIAPAFVLAIALGLITLYRVTWIEGSASFFGWRPFGPLPHPGFDGRIGTDDDLMDWKLRLLPFVVMWPAMYMLAITSWQRIKSSSS